MKKLLYLSFTALVAVSMLQSCNKKLKKELAELDNSVTELKNKNTDLENQLLQANSTITELNSVFEADKPLNWTYNTTDNGVSPSVSFSKSYSAKYLLDAKSDYQYIENLGSGEYGFYIGKSEDFDWDDMAYVYIYFNGNAFSSVNTGSNLYAYHYEEYDGGTYFQVSCSKNQGDVTMTLNSFSANTTTGDVSFDLSYSDASGYTFGTTESGTFSWSGNCFIYAN